MLLNQYWLIVAAILLFSRLAIRFVRHRKSSGPWLSKFTSVWYFYKVWKGDFERTNIELHEKYGKIVCVEPSSYSIDDPEAASIIYGHGTQFTKSDWYLAWTQKSVHAVNLFALQEIDHHRRLRRRYANLYSMSTMKSYESRVDGCVELFCQMLADHAERGSAIDFRFWLQIYALDVIGEISFSQSFDLLKSGEDSEGLIDSLENFTDRCCMNGLLPNWLMSTRMSLSNPGLNTLMKFIGDHLQRRTTEYQDEKKVNGQIEAIHMDFLTRMLQQEEGKNDELSPLMGFGAVSQNVMAGSDTTGITLIAIFSQLLANPKVMHKLQSELDDASINCKLSDPITFAESQELPYLQAVIKESMRLHPATGLPLWRIVPAGGAEICGQWLPAGTKVGINSWVAHHNKSVFGSDAAVYRPERWIEADHENLTAMQRYFMPFGLGSRTCIGKNISLLEMGKLVPEVLRRFQLQPAEDCARQDSFNRWFVKQKHLQVIARIK